MKYRTYSIEQKLEAVALAQRTSISNAAKTLKIDRKRVREWMNNKQNLTSVANPRKTKRLSGGGRKLNCEVLEAQLIQWINNERCLHHRVSRKMIQRKAIEIFHTLEESDKRKINFKASLGWLFKFLKRNRFSLRKRTTIAQTVPEDIKEKVMNYILYVDGLKQNCTYPLSAIGSADETAVWVDPIQDATVETVGAKSVPIFSTGYHKAKFTVMLSAKANGSKLKPFIALKGKRLPKELSNFNDADIVMTSNGWMNEDTTLTWIKNTWGTFSFGRRLLAWDAFRCHKTEAVKKELKTIRTDIAMIPGGCTGILQAPDVSWNKPFKSAFTDLYEAWVQNEAHKPANKTKGGNCRPPSKFLLCSWVVKSWKALSADIIIKSFKLCALTTKSNGTEDNMINAVKKLELLPTLQERRKTAAVMNIEDEVESSDDEEVVEDEDIVVSSESSESDLDTY